MSIFYYYYNNFDSSGLSSYPNSIFVKTGNVLFDTFNNKIKLIALNNNPKMQHKTIIPIINPYVNIFLQIHHI